VPSSWPKSRRCPPLPSPLRAAFSPQDQNDLAYARAILRGEIIHGEWTDFTASPPAAAVDWMLKQAGPQGGQFALAFAAP
jgi:hypothetical protein